MPDKPDELLDLPGFRRDARGRPIIDADDASIFGFGQLIRITEELLLQLFSRGLLSGTTHTCLGQELCQLAVVRALDQPDDVVLSNHRNHGHFLTYSGHVVGLLAEVMGRTAGVCGGYGGSQHMAWQGFHSNGVQAGMTALGVGQALDIRRRGSRGVVAIMIGDGTLGEGLLYESMNLAAVWEVPALFVVENNGIAQTTETHQTLRGTIEARGAAFGLRTWRLDDADPNFIAAAANVVAQMRERGGPGMLVVDTCRLGPHSKGDDLRDPEVLRNIAARDPLAALGRRLAPALREQIESRNRTVLQLAEAQALASPEARFESVPQHAFRAPVAASGLSVDERAANVRASINAALRLLLEQRSDVLLIGEDLHEPYGGAFKVTAGLSSAFPGRVLSTPISEAGITGAGIGLAMAGRRPIVEIMFADFLTLCMDQIYNHAVKFPGMFEDCAVPLILRAPCGGRRGYGPTHSQSLENLYVSVPGLTVVFGSHRHNVGQLLIDAATRWPNPVVFLEHKLLYSETQSRGDYETLAPHAEDPGAALFPTLRRGSAEADVTLVAFGGILPLVERAALRLADEEELAVEIVAPSLLAPLPRHTLARALAAKTRVVLVEESHHEFGVSAEIAASLAEAGFRGTLVRLGAQAVPIAAARSLESAQLVDEDRIVARVRAMF